MEHILNELEKRKRLVLPTLILSISSIDPPSIIIGMSLIEIASSFGVSIGLAAQIQSITSIMAIAVALAMGVLSVRYSYKNLLLTGLLISLISVICCSFAPSFTLLVVFFSAMGFVTSLVTPMVYSYIGEYYDTLERSKVVGTLSSLRSVSYLVMVQLIGYVVGDWEWRYAFLFVAPMIVLGFLSTYLVLPNIRSEEMSDEIGVLEGYRNVLSLWSALACLVGNMLVFGSWVGVFSYSVTYLREEVSLGLAEASNVFSMLIIGVIIGNFVGGVLAGKFGVKRLVVVCSFMTGLLIYGYMNVSSFVMVLILIAFMSVMAGIILTCTNTLLLCQVPSFRGTVMSLNSAAAQLGIAASTAIGGLVLSSYGWGVMGLTFCMMHLIGAIVFYLGAVEEK